MTEEQPLTGMEGKGHDENVDLYALLFKYLAYWPWFVASVAACLAATFVYLRFQPPVYQVDAAVLIKEDDGKKGGAQNNPLAAMQDLGMFSMSNNFDNEVEILKSRTLVKKVVADLKLYASVAERRAFGHDVPLYRNSPVEVYMTPEEADRLEGAVSMEMDYSPSGSLTATLRYTAGKERHEVRKSFKRLPAVFPTPVGVVTFSRNDSVPPPKEAVPLSGYVASPTAVAEAYARNLGVDPTSKTTTIAQLSVRDTDPRRGVDFINRLVAIYNQDTNDEKNEVAQKSAEFIDERLGIINRELGNAETELADFKQRSGLTDLTSDAQLALQENSKYEQQRIQNATQIKLVESLRGYINNPANDKETLPSNIGLEDPNLSAAIDQYNTLIIERKRLLRTSSENNPAVVNLNDGIEAMHRNVLTTVQAALKGLQIAQADIDRQSRKYEGRISSAPQQEKQYLSISRQQEIKATLYTVLLQKREENAITLASTANNGRLIETPLASDAPVAPKKKMFMLAALLVGLGIPVGVVYLRDLLRYKLEERSDIEKITPVPVIAELPLAPKPAKGAIAVHENQNGLMEETFRSLRTNLLFMMGEGAKVVMFTSTEPGEGKSFVAGNTAVSLAYLGKKVVIVGLDIRKPGLNRVFDLPHHAEGITGYLANPAHVDLHSLIRHSAVSPNLDILPGGAVPPNPTELLARKGLDDAIAELKRAYDYILLDTAPIAMVTDTSIAARVADLCVYVCRAGVTPKAGFAYINVLRGQKGFPPLAVVFNGIDMSKRRNSYGYGYGSRYGYGQKYGYGYGYGHGYGKEEDGKGKKKK